MQDNKTNHRDGTRIAVMKFSALGDIARALPLMRAFEEPPCIITSPVGKALLEDEFDDFLILKKKNLSSHLRLAHEIRRRQFSDLIDIQGNERARFFSFYSGSTIHHAYHPRTRFERPYSDFVKEIETRIMANISFNKKPRSYIVFNPGSSPRWSSKRLPDSKWCEFADIVNARYGLPIKLTGSEEEVDYVTSVANKLPGEIEVVAGKTSLVELKALLTHAFLTVSTDSAALHISTIQGTPSIGIFGATPWFIPPDRPWMTCLYDHTYYPDGVRPSSAQPEIRNYYDHIDLNEGLDALKEYIK